MNVSASGYSGNGIMFDNPAGPWILAGKGDAQVVKTTVDVFCSFSNFRNAGSGTREGSS